jgi:hypothetical protein
VISIILFFQELVEERYNKYRKMGKFKYLTTNEINNAKQRKTPTPTRTARPNRTPVLSHP